MRFFTQCSETLESKRGCSSEMARDNLRDGTHHLLPWWRSLSLVLKILVLSVLAKKLKETAWSGTVLESFPLTSCHPGSQVFLWFFYFYFFLLSFFFFFSFIFISLRLINLQYCSGFGHTLTWISHGLTCVPHPDPPSHLPPQPNPLGRARF